MRVDNLNSFHQDFINNGGGENYIFYYMDFLLPIIHQMPLFSKK